MPHPAITIEETTLDRVTPLRLAYLFPGNPALTDVIDHLDNHTARHWVAVHNGQDIACATLAIDTNTVAGHTAHHRLRWLGVHPAHRQQGIARALIHTRLIEAHTAGAEYAWASARLAALPTYLHLGAIPDHHHYLDDGTITHVNVLYGPLPAALTHIPT